VSQQEDYLRRCGMVEEPDDNDLSDFGIFRETDYSGLVPNTGFEIWGQQTLTHGGMARRVRIIEIRNQIDNFVGRYVFMPNDERTREDIQSNVSAMLQLQGDIIDYNVICDETNNPPSDVDGHQPRCDVRLRQQNSVQDTNLRIVLTP
jgi:phage tail sheath protein FI